MKTQPHSSRPTGFALVVTLALMILLTVIAVGLLTLSSISLRASGQGEAMATARANARLALMLALGDLQKTLGPDRAITANSEIFANEQTSSIAKPNTTGVWESWWEFNPNASPEYSKQKTSRFRRWLVSNADLKTAQSRNFVNTAWTGKTIELVGDGSLGANANDSAKVTAGLVPISVGKTKGSYAWHVADESVKARINVYRDPNQNTTLAQKRALLAGHRPDPSVMKGADGTSPTFLPTDLKSSEFTDAKEKSGKLLDLDQVELLKQAKGKVKQFRNDMTPYSLGLLTNVRRGGLKQDLSSVFEMNETLPTEFNNKKLYESTQGVTGVSDPYWSTLAGYYNSFRSIITPEAPNFLQAPKVDLELTPTTPTAYYPGPVVAKIETLFTFVARDAHSSWKRDLQNFDPTLTYMGHFVCTPIVTLHNPYNVSISFRQLEVVFRNLPVAFQIFVNNTAQNTALIPLCEMFVNAPNRGEKSFALNIAKWTSPTATAPNEDIIMTPGQALVCSPYLDPSANFTNGQNVFFDMDNKLSGVDGSNGTINAIKARPGFFGRCIGFDLDWLAPQHVSYDPTSTTDGGVLVLGLRPTDNIYIKSAVRQPTLGPNTKFDVTVKLTANGVTKKYGGLSFDYQNSSTLQTLLPTTITSKTWTASEAYVSNVEPINGHAQAKTFAIFSAYARTSNGGVYENGQRSQASGGINALLDGRLAGKPFLFHNPASAAITMDFSRTKPGVLPYELNFQALPDSVDDILPIDSLNRSPSLNANTDLRGVKSGSYIEIPTGPMQTIADFRRSNALTSSYLPHFVQPVGNSSLHPLMSSNKVIENSSAISATPLLDHSILSNHAFYDRFYFSTFATRGNEKPDAVFEKFMNYTTPLPSQAFLPYRANGQSVADAKAALFSSGKPNEEAYKTAAEYQMVQSPFNVNSTSVQAWKAVLASMNKSTVATLWAKNATLNTMASPGVPIMGMSLLNGGLGGGAVDAANIDDVKTNDWNGYRELSDAQLTSLAEAIVKQVRQRGPFLSMSEFVNRQVGPESTLTLSGALENAISDSRINDTFMAGYVTPLAISDFGNTALYSYKTPGATIGNPAAGAPGWISQGDLLRILEPGATVRSDTFVIRVYGDAKDAGGAITARAYAEAVVQRVPEYVDPVNRPSVNVYTDAKAATANKTFGRRMNVVSFRWLSSNEI